jgi:hypothetical protein
MLWFGKKSRKVGRSIYLDKISSSARNILLGAGFRQELDLAKADSLWVRKNHTSYFPNLAPHQLINHLPAERELIHKSNLAMHLREYQRSCVPDEAPLSEIFQETYCLDNEDQREAFLSARPNPPSEDDLWILKPGGLSRGEGIKILWDFRKMKNSFRTGGKLAKAMVGERYVAQRYIRNPLLLEGRKSEVRIYWLVASVRPLMVLMYQEGTTRLNTLPFKLGDFDNPLVHVTNVYQQKKNPEFDPSVSLKWSWPRLQVYINDHLGKSDETFLEKQLKPAIHRAVRFVVKATFHKLMKELEMGAGYCLFGADLILDDDLHPWLTEVQKNPGLDCDNPVTGAVFPPMLSEAVTIMHEVQERRLNDEDFRNLKTVDGYEWVINEVQPELVMHPPVSKA